MKHSQEETVSNLIRLKEELGREPTITEVNECSYLPNARYIQRNFGGIKYLRKLAGFDEEDHTIGSVRRKTALRAHERAKEYERVIYKKIVSKWHREPYKVIRDFAYQQYVEDGDWYKNIACDVAIMDYKDNHAVLIDFFYPQDMHSFGGCVRIKRKKLEQWPVSLLDGMTHTSLFVCVNPAITKEMVAKNKTNRGDALVLSLEEFESGYMV